MPLATILVEDSVTVRQKLTLALAELADVEVIAVGETASEGITVLTANADIWELAVVDLFLKDGNGLEVLRAVQERREDQHVLLLTNFAPPEIRERSIDAGADGVFNKSTEVDLFLERCNEYSNQKSNRRAASG